MSQCLSIKGMHFYANHGHYAHEKEVGGNYTVDVDLHLQLVSAAKSDKLSDTVNYEVVYEICKDVMSRPKHLIETLAYEILETIFNEFTEIDRAQVKVTKIKPPIKGDVDQTSVLFSRDRSSDNTESNYWEERAKY